MSQLFVQAQPFTLFGAGATIGDTSITLTNFNGIDGVPLVMANFGSKGWGTMEPASSSQEEQISWTGVVPNANGSVTLTGISSVDFVSPYTETSGLRKSHSGASPFVISNTSAFYSGFANVNNDELVTGHWTFQNEVTIPITPSAATDAASKGYVDSVVTTVGGITALLVAKDGVSPTLLVNVGSGGFIFGSAFGTYAGSSANALTPSTTNYVQLRYDGTLIINTSGFIDGYLPLATVITSGTDITSLVDKRPFFTNGTSSQTVYPYETFGATLNFGDPAFINAGTGRWNKALSTSAANADGFAGIVIESGINGSTPRRVMVGGVWGSASGLTANAPVYLTDVGGFSSTPGTYKKVVGWSLSTTEFVMLRTMTIDNTPGSNSSTTTANLNALMTFQNSASVDWTAANANILVAGPSSDAETLHTHTNLVSLTTQPTFLRVMNAASGTVTYAHGLGVVPRSIQAILKFGVGSSVASSDGSWSVTAGSSNCIYTSAAGGSSQVDTTLLRYDESGGVFQSAIVSAIDATNVTLTWTKTGSPGANTVNFLLICRN